MRNSKEEVMTPSEIRKLAITYSDRAGLSIDYVMDIESVLEELSEDYAIVPKTQLRELYGCYKQHESVIKEKGLYEAEMIARGSQATMRDIFGSQLFEEGEL